MELVDVYLALGEEKLQELLKSVSISRLRTYQMFDQVKTRTRLTKLNSEHLQKAAPRLFERMKNGEKDLATDLAQAILVSHLDMIIETLNFLGIPHQDGFFAKDANTSQYLTDGWQQKAYEGLKDKYPATILVFYINHLAAETGNSAAVYLPGA
ncbi:MAG: hypothetical protein IT161_17985 [Bryobacterales bacterium]|nr:hypothetical protein [Bryobacterales bacterium]